MKGYSQDLRERIIKQWQDGSTQRGIAETFSVSLNTVKRYIRRYQATGNVHIQAQQREQPLIGRHQYDALRAMVDADPDARLSAYVDAWGRLTGVKVSASTMCRALQRADRPRKKRRLARVSGM